MSSEIESYSPLAGRATSPLRQAMFGRDRGNLDSWLAGMNAVGLSFLLIAAGALLPAATASRLKPVPPLPAPGEMVEVELVADPGPPPVASGEPEPAPDVRLEEPEPEPLDQPPPPEPVAYREMPEMIDPVPVVEPERRPVAMVQEPRRPLNEARRPVPAVPRPAPLASRSSTANPGVPGGPPGGSAASQGAAGRSGRGTTPQPPYPSFARRDKLQGTVVVRISVTDGAVSDVRLVSSSGSAALDQYAVSHVQRRWKWSAGTTRTFIQPFRFVLQ